MRTVNFKYLSLPALFLAFLLAITCISCCSQNNKNNSGQVECIELDSLVSFLNSLEPKGDTLFLSKRQFTSYEYRTAMVQQDDSTYNAKDPTTFSEALYYDHIYSFGIRTWSEPDIDKRAALALEYVQWRETEGLEMLGDIMESGIYTKYLLEIWYTWRAICQSFSFSTSSSGFIPNRYYSKMKVRCANTILRHIQETDDLMAKCLLDELLMPVSA